jgi:hypothetical protein
MLAPQDMKQLYWKDICQQRHSHHTAREVGSKDVNETKLRGLQQSL